MHLWAKDRPIPAKVLPLPSGEPYQSAFRISTQAWMAKSIWAFFIEPEFSCGVCNVALQ